MTPHDATMTTASLFEQRPGLYDYQNVRVPPYGSPGCALGYIGHFAGIPAGHSIRKTTRNVLGLKYSGYFYMRMNALAGGHWNDNAFTCATALRLYADKYLQPAHTGIPASVSEVFESEGVAA